MIYLRTVFSSNRMIFDRYIHTNTLVYGYDTGSRGQGRSIVISCKMALCT